MWIDMSDDIERRHTILKPPRVARILQDLPDRAPEDLDRRYRSLFEGVPIGLYITTPSGTIVDANQALVDMLGYPEKDILLGMSAASLYEEPGDRDQEQVLLEQECMIRDFETKLVKWDGSTIWVRDTCRAVTDEHGHISAYEGSLQDITVYREYERRLSHMARHDPLTGVYNRHALAEILDTEIGRARRYRHPIGILMVDVNRFKEVNDRFGHTVGDQVLCCVAQALCSAVRETDTVVRFGGDEFLILLTETDGEIEIVKERIDTELSLHGQMSFSDEFPITVSIGTAHWDPAAEESIERVLHRADVAMYNQKQNAIG